MSHNRYDIDNTQINHTGTKLLYISTSSYGGDWHSSLHTHYFTELFYVIKGSGKFIVEDESFEVKEDDLVIINPKVLHTEVSIDKKPLEYVVLGIEGLTFLFEHNESLKDYSVYNYRRQKNEFWFYFNMLTKEIENKPPNYEIICQNMLEILLINIMRHSDTTISIVPSNQATKETAMVKRYIDLHFKEKITLDDLAEVVHMNKFYLAHSFSQSYNMSPINYLIEKRVMESKYLLEKTDYSLSQIARIVGFSSPSYFSQTFKRVTNETPKDYRNKKKTV